jgi:glycosyltransferase involved in cell wall biosynthesis
MKLRVLLVDDGGSQCAYGEAGVTDLVDSLDRAGHEVSVFPGRSHEPGHFSRGVRLAQSFWWLETIDSLREQVKSFRPTIIHMLSWNTQLSPSVYRVTRQSRIPLVQAAPDFQLHCLKGTYFRDQQRCEDCLGRSRVRGVVRRCKSGSLSASVGLATTLGLQELLGNFSRVVTLYLAPTYYARRKLIDGGLPREKVIVRAPYVDIPLPDDAPRENALYVGPLNDESGFVTLMQAAVDLAGMKIDAAGYDQDDVIARHIPAFNLLGQIDDVALYDRMARSRFLIHPAPSYVGFPATIVKAFGARLPVIASAIGGFDEIVEDGRTGLLFEAGNATDLERKIQWAHAHPEAMAEMGRNARRTYQERYSSMRGARQLVDAYDLARQLARGPNFETEEITVNQMK